MRIRNEGNLLLATIHDYLREHSCGSTEVEWPGPGGTDIGVVPGGQDRSLGTRSGLTVVLVDHDQLMIQAGSRYRSYDPHDPGFDLTAVLRAALVKAGYWREPAPGA